MIGAAIVIYQTGLSVGDHLEEDPTGYGGSVSEQYIVHR